MLTCFWYVGFVQDISTDADMDVDHGVQPFQTVLVQKAVQIIQPAHVEQNAVQIQPHPVQDVVVRIYV